MKSPSDTEKKKGEGGKGSVPPRLREKKKKDEGKERYFPLKKRTHAFNLCRMGEEANPRVRYWWAREGRLHKINETKKGGSGFDRENPLRIPGTGGAWGVYDYRRSREEGKGGLRLERKKGNTA